MYILRSCSGAGSPKAVCIPSITKGLARASRNALLEPRWPEKWTSDHVPCFGVSKHRNKTITVCCSLLSLGPALLLQHQQHHW